jgi:NTE family protein
MRVYQPKSDLFADLVLEGGGVKGIGLVGAISVLEKEGYKFNRLAGTSAGAITASLVAGGCKSDELVDNMRSIDYNRFRDETFFSRFAAPGKVASLLLENGLYKGDYVRDWIAERLAGCGIKTFGDLKLDPTEYPHLPKNEAYKLVVVTADLSKGGLVYLPWDYHKYGLDPDKQSVADAVRASISLPYFYKPARLGKSTLVDGGVLSNFPVDIFDNSPDWPTIGIKLSSKEKATQVPRHITGPISLATALFTTMMSGHDQRHLDDPNTQARTIFVDTMQVQATDFDISSARQQSLFENGQKASEKFLKTWDFTKYQEDFPPNI